MFINFGELGQFPEIFREYLYNFNKVKKYYYNDFRDTAKYPDFFRSLLETKLPHQSELAHIIRNQYQDKSTSEKTAKSLSLLDHENSLFIITGQQLGMFSGPLYTIYKAITAIKLAEHLNQQYVNINFIPVFWLEGDDHDFDEIRKATIISDENAHKRVYYDDGLPEDADRGFMGELMFNENIVNTLNDLHSSLRKTEFTDSIVQLFQTLYKPGSGFKEGFREILRILFDEYGLIIFDPQDNRIKNLLRPVFLNELENFRPHTEQLIRISAELEEVYHAQAKIRPVNLFIRNENSRFALEPLEEGGFRLKRKKLKYTKEELEKLITEQPELFSPNVMLRPVCQDYLFKTAFYIGGPGEISYFAQAFSIYNNFNIHRPILFPRASVTLIEKNIQNAFSKYSVEYSDIFTLGEKLIDKIITEKSLTDLDTVFGDASNTIEQSFGALKSYIAEIDKVTSDSVDKYKTRTDQFLEELKKRTLDAEKNKNETITRQFQKALMSLLPFNELQERALNYFYFANKYGPGLIHRLYNEIDIQKFEHQLIEL